MPELPEVETLRRSLEPTLLGASIDRVKVNRREVIVAPGDPPGGFSRHRGETTPTRLRAGDLLRGETVRQLRRHGKQLAIVGGTDHSLLIHLGMTGQMLVQRPKTRLPDHAHVVWSITTSSGPRRLLFRDPRRFGGLWVIRTTEDLERRWRRLGPDASVVRTPELVARLAATRRPLKAALLDQTVVAGLGNIYADESCHLAQIRPDRLTATLEPPEVDRLATSIRTVLKAATRLGGSTLRDYRDAQGRAGDATSRHAVYGRAGQPCPTCGCPLSTSVLAGRTTVWCDRCAQ